LGRDSQAHDHPWGPGRGLFSQQGPPSHLAEVWIQPRPSLAVPKTDRARGGGQVQSSIQTIRQHHGNEAGLESRWEVNPQVMARTQSCDYQTSLTWAEEPAQRAL